MTSHTHVINALQTCREESVSAQKNLKEWAPTEHWNCPTYEHQDSGTGWGSDLLKDSHEKAALAVIRWGNLLTVSLGQTKGQAGFVRLAVTKSICPGKIYGWFNHTATLPLHILLTLRGSGQDLCSHSLHRIPFILWLSMLIYSFGYPPSSSYPSHLCCAPFQMHRGVEWHWVLRVKMLVVIFLSVALSPHIPPGQSSYCITLPFLSEGFGNRGFALISTLCQESPVCHSNSLSCGYRTNNKNNSQPKFPPGNWLSLGFSLGFQKHYLSFPTYPGINKPYFSPCISPGH